MLGNANNEVMQFGRISLQCELKLQDLLSVSNSLIHVTISKLVTQSLVVSKLLQKMNSTYSVIL